MTSQYKTNKSSIAIFTIAVAPAVAPDDIADPLTFCAGTLVAKVEPFAAVNVSTVYTVVCVALYSTPLTAARNELIIDSAFAIREE